MADNATPSAAIMWQVDTLYALVGRDTLFSRLRRLMEVDWSQADTTVEELGLPRLLGVQACKLRALRDSHGAEAVDWADIADAIRYTERHDPLAQDALWWLRLLASDPLLRDRR